MEDPLKKTWGRRRRGEENADSLNGEESTEEKSREKTQG